MKIGAVRPRLRRLQCRMSNKSLRSTEHVRLRPPRCDWDRPFWAVAKAPANRELLRPGRARSDFARERLRNVFVWLSFIVLLSHGLAEDLPVTPVGYDAY